MFGTRDEDEFINDVEAARAYRRGGGTWPALLVAAAGIGAFLAWAAVFEIEEVTSARGRVVPTSEVQVVQSLEGGIVREIAVGEGDLVEAGQVLIEIDDTTAAAERGELLEREAGLLAEAARTEAEAEGRDEIVFPPGLAERAPGAVAAEEQVFRSRRAQLQSELQVLEDQLAQRRSALEELRANRARTEAVLAPLREELALTEDLSARGAVPQIELFRLQSRVAELEGDLGVADAGEPKLQAELNEARSQIETARRAYVLTARERLARLGVELAVVTEALRAATDRVTRTRLRAPVRGTVNTISANSVGAVVQPGAPLVEIVPVEDGLRIEAEVRPQDVAFIRPGHSASVKITAYDFTVYGALAGEVLRIGADTVEDREGAEVFKVTVSTESTVLVRGGQSYPITPGMVAQVDIQTGRKTVLSYLAKPILRAQAEALRER
jgi:adhesin transport system membrane fusion protein